MNVILLEAVLQYDRASLQELWVLLDDLTWSCLEALMHGIQCKLPLLPVFVLALLIHNRLVTIKALLSHSQVNLNVLIEASFTDVDDIDG